MSVNKPEKTVMLDGYKRILMGSSDTFIYRGLHPTAQIHPMVLGLSLRCQESLSAIGSFATARNEGIVRDI